MRQARTCRVRAPGPTPSAPKQWNSDVDVESLKPCQREIATDEIRENIFKKKRLANRLKTIPGVEDPSITF